MVSRSTAASASSADKAKSQRALVLSRSVAQGAPALSNEILENVQLDVLASLDEQSNRRRATREILAEVRKRIG